MRFRDLFFGISIALFLVIILFFLCETIFRLAGLFSTPAPFAFVSDKELGYFIKPNFYRGHHLTPDGEPYEIFTNSLGLFDKEFKGESPVILLIGDSFTISAVPYPNKWGTLLEQKIGIRTVKAGVSGYGTLQEFRLLKRLVPKVKPEIVILGYYMNDPVDDFIGINRYGVINGYLKINQLIRLVVRCLTVYSSLAQDLLLHFYDNIQQHITY